MVVTTIRRVETCWNYFNQSRFLERCCQVQCHAFSGALALCRWGIRRFIVNASWSIVVYMWSKWLFVVVICGQVIIHSYWSFLAECGGGRYNEQSHVWNHWILTWMRSIQGRSRQGPVFCSRIGHRETPNQLKQMQILLGNLQFCLGFVDLPSNNFSCTMLYPYGTQPYSGDA